MAALTIRVAAIEDHPIVIGGLEAALARVDDVRVVARAATIAEARAVLGRDDVDVAVLDIRLADGNSLQLLAEASRPTRPAVLVLSSFDTPEYVAAALRLGASGFLVKTAPFDELLDAIRRVARGGLAFTIEQLRVGQSGSVSLTRREGEILRLLLRGRSNNEIAHEIGAARKTVEAHLGRMFGRFGVSSRVELALAAERGGWMDLARRHAATDATVVNGGPVPAKARGPRTEV